MVSNEERAPTGAEQIQFTGNNLVERLDSFVNAGGDVHSVIQAQELFIRAVIMDCLVRTKLLVIK